ncbi:MAG: aspartate--tRNA ligase [Rhodobacteraceae bacterium]|nr:aspartate--tRNA ligase [Paracoccaceae bacterium]
MSRFRSHTCGELNQSHVGSKVRLSGWVHRMRDHGGVLFIDLRDHYGITQVLCDHESPIFETAGALRSEACIRVDGAVRARASNLVNPKLPTGGIEVFIHDLEVLGAAEELPLMVFGDQEYPEETRLRYRYLDLRREAMQRNMILRSDVIASLRRRMWNKEFREYQTPIITASSPEGARDFLVPSRLHPGRFYALPQAPQLFKQLIMVSGFDRYFQIAPCFRDEDPRADRSPTDFYQLDMEMSYVAQQDIFDTLQPVIEGVFSEFAGGRKVDSHWPQIPFRDALLWYGTDKPDLRNPIRMQDVSKHFHGSGFAVFARLLQEEGTEVRAIPAPGGGSRRFCDRMDRFARQEGLAGMGYIFWRRGGAGEAIEAAGPIAKNLGEQRSEALRQELGLGAGDAVFFVTGKAETFAPVAAKARMRIGQELKLVEPDRFAFAWIVDFPMYEADAETGKIEFSHNPFSMPQGGLAALEGPPLQVLGHQYDLTCNGYELASGAIRTHKQDIMYKAFALAGYGRQAVDERFGGLVNALRFGAPPHGGCAAGIDRMVMLLADTANIREVVMFPMTQRAEDLMMGAPRAASSAQLMELGLRVMPTPDEQGSP